MTKAWSLVAVLVLAIVIGTSLGARLPNVVDVAITERRAGWGVVPVELGVTAEPDGASVARATLVLQAPETLIVHETLRLAIATYGQSVDFSGGELRVVDTDCVYRTPPGAAFTNNSFLTLVRAARCDRSAGLGAVTTRLDLEFRFNGPARAALLSYDSQGAAREPGWITFAAGSDDPSVAGPVLVGRYVDNFGLTKTSRADLLAYLWARPGQAGLIWGVFGLAMVLLATGALLLAAMSAANVAGPLTRRSVLRAAGGTVLTGLGVALAYAILVPPFQSADEPDHFLAYAQLVVRPDLATGAEDLARLGHFDRIRFHGDERFQPRHVGQPASQPWGPEVFAHDVRQRSVTTATWWRLLSLPLQRQSTANTLLGVRLANAAFFAFALGLSVLVLARGSGAEPHATYAPVLALLIVPTLPFFATMMSEFALLTSLFVVVAALAAGLVIDGPRSQSLGLPLGLAMSLILASGRSALPFVGVFIMLVAGRAVLASNLPDDGTARDGTQRQSGVFWIGLALGLLVFPMVTTSEFRAGLWPSDAGRMPGWFKLGAELLRQQPWVLLLVAPMGFGAEWAIARIRRSTRRPATPGPADPAEDPVGRWRPVVRAASLLAILAVVFSLAASLVVPFPVLTDPEAFRPASATAYVSDLLQVASTGLRLTNHDFYLSQSLWGGFGWIDTLPGDAFVSGIVLVFAAVLCVHLYEVGRRGSLRRVLWLPLIAGGAVLSLVAYALASYFVHRSVHGRYLIGVGLLLWSVVWSVAAWVPRAGTGGVLARAGVRREVVLVALIAGVHTWALTTILTRYF